MAYQYNFDQLKDSMKWRYLDSLDSTRYSPKEFIDEGAIVPQRLEQAEIELAATMLMGNGIVVPNNQLMDSVGYIHIISSLIEKAQEYTNNQMQVFIPIRWAKFDYKLGDAVKDPFNLVAAIFDKDGKEDHGYFELSSWQNLVYKRREFAEYLRNRAPLQSSFFDTVYEKKLAAELLTILRFFKDSNSFHNRPAADIQGVRDQLTDSIADLTDMTINSDPFFLKMLENDDSSVQNQKIEAINSIITVLKRVKTNVDPNIRSDRTIIRQVLVEKPEVYFANLPVLPVTIRKGVLKTINTLYNFSNFISTDAEQDHQTEPMEKDTIWGVDEASFALGQWARYQYIKKGHGEKATHDISTTQDTYVDPNIVSFSDPKKKTIWDKFFYCQRDFSWITSMTRYMNSLRYFENAKRDYLNNKDLQNEKNQAQLSAIKEEYQICRSRHIEKVNELLGYNNYKIMEIEDKAYLICKSTRGEIESKIQIEDFSENQLLTSEEISALYSGQIADENTTNKGITGEFGNNNGKKSGK